MSETKQVSEVKQESEVKQVSEVKLVSEIKEDSEIWKSLSSLGYSKYMISSHGRLYHIKNSERFLGTVGQERYVRPSLMGDNNKTRSIFMHVLVATMFIPKPSDDPNLTVDHIDKDRSNNKVTNLRWATKSEQKLNRDPKYKNKGIGKRIDQLDMNGKLIKIWDSKQSAADSVGITVSAIYYACKKNRARSGFYWRDHVEEILPGEIWKLTAFEDLENVEISNYGRIKAKNGGITYGAQCERGYKTFMMKIIGSDKKRHVYVHRAVLSAFLGNKDGMFVNHINADKTDNRLGNLEYTTHTENLQHASKMGAFYGKGLCKKVDQYTLDGTYIKTYVSMMEAKSITKIDNWGISRTCRKGGGIYGGYIWKFHPKDTPQTKDSEVTTKDDVTSENEDMTIDDESIQDEDITDDELEEELNDEITEDETKEVKEIKEEVKKVKEVEEDVKISKPKVYVNLSKLNLKF